MVHGLTPAPVLSPSHSSLMPASLASSCFWGHTPFLPKWLGPRPPLTAMGGTETPLAPGSDTTGQARLSTHPCPNSLSCYFRGGILVHATFTETEKCPEADPLQTCAWSFLMVQQLLPGDFWSLPLSLLFILCVPCLSLLLTLPPSLISFFIEKAIDQISLDFLPSTYPRRSQ